MELFNLIQKAQVNMNDILDLITLFDPLIKKYGYLLGYDDAYNDMRLQFIEIIIKIDLENMKSLSDGSLIVYINKSLRNEYINKSKKQSEYKYRNRFISDVSEQEAAVLQRYMSATDSYFELEYKSIYSSLTQTEFETVLLIYYYGFTVSEIARCKHISRQAVNQLKNKAIQKLRPQFM